MIESTVSGVEIGTMGMAGVAILGLFATWIKNGKSQAKHMSEMETRQGEQTKTIFNKLDDLHTGLGAIKESVDSPGMLRIKLPITQILCFLNALITS